MKPRDLTLDDLLQRVTFTDLTIAVVEVLKLYNIGSLRNIKPLFVGHDELNTIVSTEKGGYVFKFFNKKKQLHNLEAVVRTLDTLAKFNIPVPQIIPNTDGKTLTTLPSMLGNGYMCVTTKFDGVTFNEQPPTDEDIRILSTYLAHMHTLKFETDPEYDSWLLVHLSKEYSTHKNLLSTEDARLIQPIVRDFETIDLTRLSKGIVHYDLHRDNAKKNNQGNYCLFDFGTVDYGFPLFDFATFLGLFCCNPNNPHKNSIHSIQIALDEYQKHRPITPYEQSFLLTSIRGIFASNVLAATVVEKQEGNDTEENTKWYRLGKYGMGILAAMTPDKFHLS